MEVRLRRARRAPREVAPGRGALHPEQPERQPRSADECRCDFGRAELDFDDRLVRLGTSGRRDARAARPRRAGLAAQMDVDVEEVPEGSQLDLVVVLRCGGVGREEDLDAVLLVQALALY